PTESESALIVHFRDRDRHDFPDLLRRIPGAQMTRPTTMLVPGDSLKQTLEVICRPILAEIFEKRGVAVSV
ncbi:MAG: phosphoribulokinase, partial [Pseudomonadota bacterium]